jgi:hypothetical protein
MTLPAMVCRDPHRRRTVRESGGNGLDYLEVGPDGLTLEVFFLGKAPDDLARESFVVEGGTRVRDLRVVDLRIHSREDSDLDDVAVVTVDRTGDFSRYTLRVAALDDEGRPTASPPPGFDPRYDRIELSFKADCPSELDCQRRPVCIEPSPPAPEISYLAKDYASFRQLALDRLAVTLPEWTERHAPDLGIALVEILAHAADHLSYHQDAAATEAYLETARQRISVRRHARLVDYALHEGSNARAWVTLAVESDELTLPPAGMGPESFDYEFVTGFDGAPPAGTVLTEKELADAGPHEVFRTVAGFGPVVLHAAHGEIAFYTWGDGRCCLPRGATSATLADPGVPPAPEEPEDDGYGKGKHGGKGKGYREPEPEPCDEPEAPPVPEHALRLAPGDVLIFEEVKGPETGLAVDADPAHRHAVRLTRVEPAIDPLHGRPVVEIEWHPEDALPFPLCISSIGDPCHGCRPIDGVSVARGNVVLVDHGGIVEDEPLDPVPPSRRRVVCEGERRPVERPAAHPRYRPRLDRGPLVFARPYDPRSSACAALAGAPRDAVPAVEITATTPGPGGEPVAAGPWEPRAELLASGAEDRHFVAEVDNRRRAVLRFGDGELGRRPGEDESLSATYRVGGGPGGNVGAEAITHLALRRGQPPGESITVRNPLPAAGGSAPEPVDDARRLAGHAFRRELARAVTPEDYARLAERHPAVSRAAARVRWSGCSYRVLVAIDPRGRVEADDELLREVAAHLERYRRIGHEVLVGRARHVPLDLSLRVCVAAGHLRGHVLAELLERLSDRPLPGGGAGFFHPDRLSFGDGVRLSALVAEIQSVTGVDSVSLDPAYTRFRRYGEAANGEIEDGLLPLGPFEIARLDNDPSFPENGVLQLDLRGGR